jgi:hypothetical protein
MSTRGRVFTSSRLLILLCTDNELWRLGAAKVPRHTIQQLFEHGGRVTVLRNTLKYVVIGGW